MASKVTIPHLGREIVLVDREQLRFKRHGREFGRPDYLRGLMDTPLPTPPPVFSGSKNRAIKYPILGNDTVGDCYYADACHCVQTWTGNAGTEVSFNATTVVNRYKKISGGDNGLSDDQIFPEWKSGIVGPNGPHKLLDEITVNTADTASVRLGMWLFGGASYTAALLQNWPNMAGPGVVWDSKGGVSNPQYGHAMHLSGYVTKGSPLPYAIILDGTTHAAGTSSPIDFFEDETWGIDPAVCLTPDGIAVSDPEITFQFSLEMFNAQGIAPHNNMAYTTLAPLWKQLGGITLPPNPFPPTPPGPPNPPTPPVTGIAKVNLLDGSGNTIQSLSVVTSAHQEAMAALQAEVATISAEVAKMNDLLAK